MSSPFSILVNPTVSKALRSRSSISTCGGSGIGAGSNIGSIHGTNARNLSERIDSRLSSCVIDKLSEHLDRALVNVLDCGHAVMLLSHLVPTARIPLNAVAVLAAIRKCVSDTVPLSDRMDAQKAIASEKADD